MKPNKTHFEWQQGKLGKDFRLSCIHKGKYRDWYFIFKYRDGELFAFREDYKGKTIGRLDHKQTKKLLWNLDHTKKKP